MKQSMNDKYSCVDVDGTKMINNRYFLTSMWGRGFGASPVNTEERRGLAYLEVTSS